MTFLLSAARRGAAALVFLLGSAPVVAAQRRSAPEFTQQSILVSNFWIVGTVTPSLTRNDLRFGRKVGADAPKITIREESCVVSQIGADTIPIARASLEAGQDVSPEATKQFLEYLDQISPYADKQITAFCTTPPAQKKTPGR